MTPLWSLLAHSQNELVVDQLWFVEADSWFRHDHPVLTLQLRYLLRLVKCTPLTVFAHIQPTLGTLQPDQINMAVFLWNLVKNDAIVR